MAHLVWDWNGTLIDDLGVVVGAVNRALEPFGAGPIGPEDYRSHYTRPVVRFYERLLGRPVGPEEWRRLDELFHDAYKEALPSLELTGDARKALEMARRSGATQSLCSMFPHDELLPVLERQGVDGYFLRVDGLRTVGGGEKAWHLEAHLEALPFPLDGVVVIGDALDDARAAIAVGVRCVLYDGGSHHRSELEAAGMPVAASLVEAVRLSQEGR